MKITCLVDNCALDGLRAEHGLSYFVEACGRRFFFDLGQDEAFLENARSLGIDPASADFAIISHGHYDHGGGLGAFMALNPDADIFLRAGAFEKHWSDKPGRAMEYIGLDGALRGSGRIREVGEVFSPSGGLTLVSGVTGSDLCSPANDVLLGPDRKTPDSFGHEMSLLIVENGVPALIVGCAHRGVVNIMNRVFNIDPHPPKAVFGGFHLAVPGSGDVNEALVDQTAEWLLEVPGTVYYTGHCTGLPSYERLRSRMGERVRYLRAGESVEL